MQKIHCGPILLVALLIMVIPAFAFIGQGSPSASSTVLGFPHSQQSRLQENGIEPLSQTDYEANNFYLIQNHETGDIMALSPTDYIKGVVSAEMPVSFHTEALKAQAVAAHTYALRQIGQQLASPDPSLNGAYLTTDPDVFQAWLSPADRQELWGSSFDINERKLSDAVESVIGSIITFEEEPIAAAFHAISGGRTESASTVWAQSVSYLVPVDSEGDLLSPDYEQSTFLTEEEVAHALVSRFPGITLPKDRDDWFSIQQRTDSGTVVFLAAGDRTISGQELREALNLRSANFTITSKDDGFGFTTLGYGHNVGMSQYGADYLARQGYTWEEILTHYYTGVTITEIS